MKKSWMLILALLLLLPLSASAEEIITRDPVLPNGQTANAPFAREHRQKNWETFGLGNCVVASCCQNAKFLGRPEWSATFYDLTQGVPGGHYPEKLRTAVLEKAKQRHPDLKWVQWWGKGEEGHRLLLEWSARGFPIGITWGTGKRYNNQPIAHMVSLVHADDRYWQIADNNFVDEFSCVPAPEGRRRWSMNSDEWAVVLVVPEEELWGFGSAKDWMVAGLIIYGELCIFIIIIWRVIL